MYQILSTTIRPLEPRNDGQYPQSTIYYPTPEQVMPNIDAYIKGTTTVCLCDAENSASENCKCLVFLKLPFLFFTNSNHRTYEVVMKELRDVLSGYPQDKGAPKKIDSKKFMNLYGHFNSQYGSLSPLFVSNELRKLGKEEAARTLVTDLLYILPPHLRRGRNESPNSTSEYYSIILDQVKYMLNSSLHMKGGTFNNSQNSSNITLSNAPITLESIKEFSKTIFALTLSTIISNINSLYNLNADKLKASEFAKLSAKLGHVRSRLLRPTSTGVIRAVASSSDSLFGICDIPARGTGAGYLEYSTVRNLAEMKKLAEEGDILYIDIAGKWTKWTRDRTSSIAPGQRYVRKLRTGDSVIINRQPTINSFNCHGVFISVDVPLEMGDLRRWLSTRDKPIDLSRFVFQDQWSDVIRITPSQTTPLNADFDGDTLNLWNSLCSLLGKIHLRYNAFVGNTLMNGPMNAFGIVFHELLVMYRLSQWPETQFTPVQSTILEGVMKEFIATPDRSSTRLLTYKDLVETILHPAISYKSRGIHIEGGRLISGHFSSSNIGTVTGSLIHYIACVISKKDAYMFIRNANRMAAHFMRVEPMSYNHNALVERATDVDAANEAKRTVKIIGETIRKRPNLNPRELTEFLHLANVDYFLSVVEKRKTSPDINDIVSSFVSSGSKGDFNGLTQICNAVGQTFKEDLALNISSCALVPRGWEKKEDLLLARVNGFVSSSYMAGLSPLEMISQCAAARHTLINAKSEVAVMGENSNQVSDKCSGMRVDDYGLFYRHLYDPLCGGQLSSASSIVVTNADGSTHVSFADISHFLKPSPVLRRINKKKFFYVIGSAPIEIQS